MIVSFFWIIAGIVYVCYKLISESKYGRSIGEAINKAFPYIILFIINSILVFVIIGVFTSPEPSESFSVLIGFFIFCAIVDVVFYFCFIEWDIEEKRMRKKSEEMNIKFENDFTNQKNYDYIVNSLSKLGKKTTHENVSRLIEDSEFKTIKRINNPFYLYCWMCKKRTDDISSLGEEKICKILGIREEIRCLENYTHIILSEFEGLELFVGEIEDPRYVCEYSKNDYLSLRRHKEKDFGRGGYRIVMDGNGKQAFLDDNTKKRIIEKYNEEKALYSYVSNIFSGAGYNISHDMILKLCYFWVKKWQDITNENVKEFYRYLCKHPILSDALGWLKISESDIPLDESLPEIIAIDKRKTLLLEFYLRKNGLELLENDQGFVNVEDEYYHKVNAILDKKYFEHQIAYSYTPIDKSAINWATLSEESNTELKTS